MYFKSLPKIKYPWKDSTGKFRSAIVPDIFRRIQLDKFFSNRLSLVEVFLNDTDTPESVAYDYYGSTKYHWVILLANNIIDVDKEWPLSDRNLSSYIKDKYGTNNSQNVHHYVDSTNTNIIVDWDAGKLASGTIKEITNYTYEEEINNAKRQIFVLDKRYLKDIIAQYKKLVK